MTLAERTYAASRAFAVALNVVTIMERIMNSMSYIKIVAGLAKQWRQGLRQSLLFMFTLATISAGHCIAADYRLGPGDVVTVNVYDYPELLTETRVSDTGNITFPLIGEVSVSGKSPAEVEKLITTNLSAGGFIKQAQVHVRVKEFVSQKVSVIGEVKSPGKYSIQDASRVTEAIALAGGVDPETGADKAYLTRKSDPTKRLEIDLHALLHADSSHDLEIAGGDIIFIPRAPQFYIYGEVNHPGQYRLERNMTVQQAVSVGGGLTPKGTERGMEVRRKTPDGQQTVDVGPNDPLMPDDVLYIEESWF